MQLLSIVLAVLRAIPSLKEIWDEMVSLYVSREIERMRKDYREGIRIAIYEQDQRELEKAMGSSKAGEPSGQPGSVIVDELPGVRDSR